MIYTTCVSVAEDTPSTMTASLEEALDHSKYAEVRLDYLDPPQILPFLESVSSRMDRLVCTIRTSREGGRFSGSESERVALLQDAAGYGPFLLDVEYDTISQNPHLKLPADTMISWHDFTGTPATAPLTHRLRAMSRYSDTIKIVTTAKTGPDAAAILGLYAVRARTTLVAFAMGKAGGFSRICAMHLGCPFMYVSLDGPVAPGQYSLDYVKSLNDTI